MTDLYKYVDSWDGPTTFVYILILIIVIWYFYRTSIKNNFLIGIIVAVFIVSYLNNRAIVAADTEADIKKIKRDEIKPILSDEATKHDDLLSMIFSVQDFYAYNPQQYEYMIASVNNFYKLHKLSFVDHTTVFLNYGMMEQYKRDALNALKSIIFSLPINGDARNKLNIATVVLDDIMTTDLDQISYLADNRLYKHGYDIDTKIIDEGPKAFNEYDDMFKKFSYDVY
jgi:hypothetical protein